MELNTSLHSPLTQAANMRNVGNASVKQQSNQRQTIVEESASNQRNARRFENSARVERVEQISQNAKLNPTRIVQDDQRSQARVIRENDNDVTELKPLVINQPTNPATRAFLEVAASNSDFRLIDIYV